MRCKTRFRTEAYVGARDTKKEMVNYRKCNRKVTENEVRE